MASDRVTPGRPEGPGDWTTHEVTAPIPDDANAVAFGLFLAGPGRIELRNPELTRAGPAISYLNGYAATAAK